MNLQEAVDAATWNDVVSFIEGLPDDVNLRVGNICLVCPVARYLAAKIKKPRFVAVGFETVDLFNNEAESFRVVGQVNVVETVKLTPVLMSLVCMFGSLDGSSKADFLVAARKVVV